MQLNEVGKSKIILSWAITGVLCFLVLVGLAVIIAGWWCLWWNSAVVNMFSIVSSISFWVAFKFVGLILLFIVGWEVAKVYILRGMYKRAERDASDSTPPLFKHFGGTYNG